MTIATAQPDRIAELRTELSEADDRTEQARLEFLDAQREDATDARDKRKAWDRARAARNELESLILMQASSSPSAERRD